MTNLDQPVFALVNLPEVVKGALFARYSRSPKSLRRLFLDEFVGDLDISGDATSTPPSGWRRAEELYERVFFEYGDDSVAQLGGVHLACEQSSNVLTKILERGRLMAYLEQSTRYIAYDDRLPSGHYRYYRPPEILDSPLGARYVGDLDRMFDTYGELLPRSSAWLAARYPRQPGDSDFVHRQAIKAKALDAAARASCRRPRSPTSASTAPASPTSCSCCGCGRTRCPRLAQYAEMMLTELRKVIPSFLQRVDLADRGGEWSAYLAAPATRPAGSSSGSGRTTAGARAPRPPARGHPPRLRPRGRGQGAGGGLLPPRRPLRGRGRSRRVARPSRPRSAARCSRPTWGTARNRRHRPGRAFERTDYRFEVVSDYGAFRDLQRHRLLHHRVAAARRPRSATTSPTLVAEAGDGRAFAESMERSARAPRRSGRRRPGAGRLRGRPGLPHPLRHCR